MTAMSPLSRSLAQELVDMIIDHLWNESNTLGICGLVHRDWLPSSRYHLFYEVSLNIPHRDADRISKFVALLSSTMVTFPPYITDLVINWRDGLWKEWVNDALPLMSGFVGVRRLLLQDIEWSKLRDASLLTLASFPNLVYLNFRGVDFHSFDQLAKMVSAHPMLKKLTFGNASCINRPTAPFIQYPSPHSLHHLSVASTFNGDILTWILHHKAAYVNLGRLSVNLASPDDVPPTAALIRALGPSLRQLRLRMPWKVRGCEGK
jgi:hypothetical protein